MAYYRKRTYKTPHSKNWEFLHDLPIHELCIVPFPMVRSKRSKMLAVGNKRFRSVKTIK